jgi:hypothetical protein
MEMNRADTIRTLDLMFEANRYYIENKEYEECKVPYISGPPGIGKTSLVKNYANSNEMKLARLSLTSFEYYELKGLLYPNEKTKQVDILPLGLIPSYDCLLFIDELNAADHTVQKVLLDLFHEREVNGNKISDNTMIVAAGNTKEDVSEMYDLIKPLKDRCKEIELKNDVNDILSFFYIWSPNLYNVFQIHKDKLYDIIEFSKPISLRGLTCVKYFVDKYYETSNDEYKKMIEFYVGKDLSEIITETKISTDIRDLITSNDINDQSIGIYRLILTYTLYDDETIKEYLDIVKKESVITAVCHIKANNMHNYLKKFNEKYGDLLLSIITNR